MTAFRAKAWLPSKWAIFLALGLFPTASQSVASAQEATFDPSQLVAAYRVKIGDVLRTRMYTGAQTGEGIYADYPVEANGSVYLPRVGAVQVVGLSLQELRDAIRKAAGTVYESHAFTVMPIFHVAVTGAVVYPQTIEAFPGYTVFDVIAKAGGLLDKQGKRTIELIRGSQRTVFQIDDTADIGEIARTPVMGGDRVFVPSQKTFNYQRWGFFLSIITLGATVYGSLR